MAPQYSPDQQSLLSSQSGRTGASGGARNHLHLADQMETGGAKIEETLSRLNCRYQTLFFLAGWGVAFASVVGVLTSLVFFQLANLVNCIFLFFFSFVLIVLDIPGSPRWASRYRQVVRKYTKVLTRLTGKAVAYLFLGSLVTVSLWPTRHTRRSLLLVFIALTVGLFVIAVAIIGLLISLRKSLRLEKVRKSLQAAYRNNSTDAYRKYAITDTSHGMQFEEFNRMAADHSRGRLEFDVADLGIVFNALDEHQKSAINEREFCEWMSGLMTYL